MSSTGTAPTAGTANGTSEGQHEGIASADALPVSEGLMGSADPMALMQALQALPKVSDCPQLDSGTALCAGSCLPAWLDVRLCLAVTVCIKVLVTELLRTNCFEWV